MCAQYGGQVPVFRNLLLREGLLDRLGRSLAGPTLLVAPPGHGKTVLAAQLAECFDEARWVDCRGEEPEADVIEREMAYAMGREAALPVPGFTDDACAVVDHAQSVSREHRRCLVLDDVRLAETPQATETIWLTAQVLAQSGCALVVTTTDLGPEARSALRHFEMLGVDELRLMQNEALAYARMRDAPDDLGLRVWEETQGHAAFFAVVLQASCGPLPQGLHHPRLSAWIEHIIRTQIAAEDLTLLKVAAVLGRGRGTDLENCGVEDGASLSRAGAAIPLLRITDGSSGASGRDSLFVMHELLAEYVEMSMRRNLGGSNAHLDRAIDVLVSRPDLHRAARFVDLLGEEQLLRFLASHGFAYAHVGGSRRLVELLELAPLADVMSQPRLLLLWADVLLDQDEFRESLSKARAARVLADHDGDVVTACEAVAVGLDALRMMNRWDEASKLLEEGLQVVSRSKVPSAARAAIWRAGAIIRMSAGDYRAGEDLLRRTLAVESRDSRFASDAREASETLALVPCLARGDMMETARALSPWAAMDEGRLAQHVDSRGNLAVALLEVGRVDRATALLREILPIACESSIVCYLPVLGCALFADGRESEGLEMTVDGIRRAIQAGAESEAAQNRVFQAMLLRAVGRYEESLTAAERAYERLCVQDYMEFRRLAALEVAASLLALGDAAAARAWAEPMVSAGFGQNAYHALRAAMVLAECDRVDTDVQAGIERLADHVDHIRSESSNFQAALYSRAFPNLLGMIAAAVGVASLPIHMLRMVPPESAERALRASRQYLDRKEWTLLGERLLGERQFDAFVERKGRSICRVRLFGGLNVTVGDRVVHERDWKKRKARTLFAILVLNRGREVPREQLLDSIWPDMLEDRARNNFYVAWSSMKGALMGDQDKSGPCPYVDNTAGRCRIVRDAVRSDVDEFEELLANGRDAESRGDDDVAIESYERLSAIYQGELLPGDVYEDWFAPFRDRYRFEFLAAMLRLVDLLLDRDDPCNALVFARRALHVDSYREDIYQATLRCQIAAGQRSAAVETFVQCKTQLAEELGLDPSAETMALYQQVLGMEDRPRYDNFGLS